MSAPPAKAVLGIAEWRLFAAEDGPLWLLGLGSCVGLFVWDGAARLGAAAHVLLPEGPADAMRAHPAKFAQSAVPLLVEALVEAGAKRRSLEARIAGGASMFSPDLRDEGVGAKNVAAIRRALEACRLPLRGEDVGGREGRTLRLDAASGRMEVFTLRGGRRLL